MVRFLLTFSERKQIEHMYNEQGATFAEIGAVLGRDYNTVSREIKRGATGKRLNDMRPEYSAELGQLKYREALRRSGRKKTSVNGLV